MRKLPGGGRGGAGGAEVAVVPNTSVTKQMPELNPSERWSLQFQPVLLKPGWAHVWVLIMRFVSIGIRLGSPELEADRLEERSDSKCGRVKGDKSSSFHRPEPSCHVTRSGQSPLGLWGGRVKWIERCEVQRGSMTLSSVILLLSWPKSFL